jgi:hypothetical protein
MTVPHPVREGRSSLEERRAKHGHRRGSLSASELSSLEQFGNDEVDLEGAARDHIEWDQRGGQLAKDAQDRLSSRLTPFNVVWVKL